LGGTYAVFVKAEAAKRVKRTVPVVDDHGKPTDRTKQVPGKAGEGFDFKDHGTHVNVVTVDGQKLRGDQ